jgi:hypothetical protein
MCRHNLPGERNANPRSSATPAPRRPASRTQSPSRRRPRPVTERSRQILASRRQLPDTQRRPLTTRRELPDEAVWSRRAVLAHPPKRLQIAATHATAINSHVGHPHASQTMSLGEISRHPSCVIRPRTETGTPAPRRYLRFAEQEPRYGTLAVARRLPRCAHTTTLNDTPQQASQPRHELCSMDARRSCSTVFWFFTASRGTGA